MQDDVNAAHNAVNIYINTNSPPQSRFLHTAPACKEITILYARNGVNICFVQLLGEEISFVSRGKTRQREMVVVLVSLDTFADTLLYAGSRSESFNEDK